MNTREGILEDLLLAGPAGASGEALCRRAGISRAAVWKHIQALQRQGYGIEGKAASATIWRSCPTGWMGRCSSIFFILAPWAGRCAAWRRLTPPT